MLSMPLGNGHGTLSPEFSHSFYSRHVAVILKKKDCKTCWFMISQTHLQTGIYVSMIYALDTLVYIITQPHASQIDTLLTITLVSPIYALIVTKTGYSPMHVITSIPASMSHFTGPSIQDNGLVIMTNVYQPQKTIIWWTSNKFTNSIAI